MGGIEKIERRKEENERFKIHVKVLIFSAV